MRKPSQKLPHISPFLGPKISSAADLCNQKILPSHSWKEKIYQAQEILPSPIVDDVFHANEIGRSHHIFAPLADHLSDTSDKENLLSLKQKRSNWFQFHHFPKIFHQIIWKEVRNVDASKKGRASAKIFSIGDYHRSSSSVCLTKEIYHLEAQSSSVIRWPVTYG